MTEANTKNTRKHFSLIWAIFLAVVLLLPGFYKDQWAIVEKSSFREFQEDSAALVYGGLAHYGKYGVKSARFGLWAVQDNAANWNNSNWVGRTKSAWFSRSNENSWAPYMSQIGLHGWVYVALYKIFPAQPQNFSKFLELLNSALLAFFLAFIVWWVCRINKTGSILILLASILFSPWLTQIGRNVYWVSWTWLLPMITAIYIVLHKENARKKMAAPLEFVLLFSAVFVRSACGYEYISYVLVCMMLPYFAYAIENSSSWRDSFKRLAIPATAGVLGFVTAILIHAIQRSSLFDIGNGLTAIWSDVIRRTSAIGDVSAFSQVVINSLHVPLSDVISIYLNTTVITLPGSVNITALTVLEALAISWFFFLTRGLFFRKNKLLTDRSIIALGGTATFAAFAPMSWFVLAKGHSYIHQPINPVLWAVPLLPLTIAFLSATTKPFVQKIMGESKNTFELGLVAVVMLIAVESAQSDLTLSINAVRPNSVRYQVGINPVLTGGAFKSGQNVTFIADDPENFDWNTKFFVHIFPENVGDLPLDRRQFGFDNLDFEPTLQLEKMPRWSIYANRLIFKRQLPSTYQIKYIEVGQYKTRNGEQLWAGKL